MKKPYAKRAGEVFRVPWLASIDALVAELNRHFPELVTKPQEKGKTRTLGILDVISDAPEGGRREPTPEDQLRQATERLIEARELLSSLRVSYIPRDHDSVIEYRLRFASLDDLDEDELRYPALEGREGLALFVERGGLIGPAMGRHIASVIRGAPKFKSGPQYSFEEGWWRRLVVKRIATIQHLYAIGMRKAVEMFCDHYIEDDPDATAPERFAKWLQLDRREAQEKLERDDLSERDRRHFRTILDGLMPDMPRGSLKGQPFPEAFEQALRTRRSVPGKVAG